jgi:hypothetical protein
MKSMIASIVLLGAMNGLPVYAGLRSAWQFDAGDVSGSNVAASGGIATNTTGTLIADAAGTNGVLTLDGTDDYLQFGNNVTQLRALTTMTLSAWVRPGITTGTRRIVEHEDNFYFWQESNKYRFTIHGATSSAISTTSLSAGVWQHVLIVYESGKPAKIYVNGVWEDDSNANQVAMPNNTQVLSFGANRPNSGTPTAFFNGMMDDVAIWDTVLPLHQIEALAGKGVGGYTGRATPLALDSVVALKATGVRTNAATLNVRLGPTGYTATNVWAYWGTTDGGTVPGQWAKTNDLGLCTAGIASTNLTGLAANTTYYYRFCASNPNAADPNARIWTSATRRFTTGRYEPSDFSGLQLWLKADEGAYRDAGTTPVTNSSVVAQWNDWSGNSRHVSSSGTSNNITYAYDSLGEMPVIQMTDLNNGDYLRTASYQVADKDDLTVFVVSRAATQTLTGSAVHPLIGSGDPSLGRGTFCISTGQPFIGGSTNVGYFGRNYNAPTPYDEFTSDIANPKFSDGKGHVLALQLAGASTGGVGTFTGYYDGVEKESHNGTTANPANGVVEIGGTSTSAARRYAGVFGDILIYNRVLTEKERNKVGWYLQVKYGLESSYTNPYNLVLTNTAATSVLGTSATCNAELLDGDVPAGLTLYWGTSDGGTNPAAWGKTNVVGAVSSLGGTTAELTGLTPGTIYYCRFFGTNIHNSVWAPNTIIFVTQGAPIMPATDMASEIGFTTATLQASLVATSGAPAHVWAYWGTSDGGTDPNQWGHALDLGYQEPGLLRTNITGLAEGATYYVRFYAENVFGSTWTAGSQSFTTTLTTDIQTSGLVLWLRADAGVTHSNGLVDTWQDQADVIGGANNAAGSGASRPLLVNNALGGRPVLQFDGSDDILTVPDNDALDLGTGEGKAWTLITVYRRTATSGVQDIISKMGSAGSSACDWRFYISSSSSTALWGTGSSANGGAWLSFAEPTTNTFHILVGTLQQTNTTAGIKSVYVDGASVIQTNYTLKAVANTEPVRIGNFSSTGLKGYIAEILVYNCELNTYQFNKVGWYLQQKYGLSGTYRYPEKGTMVRFQ